MKKFLHLLLDLVLWVLAISFHITALLLKAFWKLVKYIFTYVFSKKTSKS